MAARVAGRLKELNLSPITAALSVGLERTYLRDFVTGRKASISTNKLELVAKALDWTHEDLTRDPNQHDMFAAVPMIEVEKPPEFVIGDRDVPVLGITLGGHDDGNGRNADFWINGDVVNYVARPKGITYAKDVFSLYVGGDSMYPRFRERDLVFVQKAPPAGGDDVVIELHPKSDGDGHPSFIKEFVRRNGSRILVRQFNPPLELEFETREIKNLFRVLTLKELVG